MATATAPATSQNVLKRQTATVDCPKSMVGRVIGKSGETIKALQTYTGALIQIDQTVEPTKVTISGTPHSLSLAVSMVTDIVKGTFKGFALLRQITNPGGARAGPLPNPMAQPRPVYAPGYGLIPPSQLYGADERTAGVVPVNYGGRSTQAAVGWAPGQVTPSQMILNMPPAGVVRPMGQPGMLGGEEAMMGHMPGYAAGMAPVYAYPPEYGMPDSVAVVQSFCVRLPITASACGHLPPALTIVNVFVALLHGQLTLVVPAPMSGLAKMVVVMVAVTCL
ncbi:hypothetical protein COO60DRAFT_1624723 [Scenedesmus sp. NREL 46B-D3]|nr:hypothetical protein COO60DRAFT_1624723 [Scenedesmus sp. NREL 46B-D3]